jgi:hypothetical protein
MKHQVCSTQHLPYVHVRAFHITLLPVYYYGPSILKLPYLHNFNRTHAHSEHMHTDQDPALGPARQQGGYTGRVLNANLFTIANVGRITKRAVSSATVIGTAKATQSFLQ